jgi:hypothetical protein
MSESKLLVYIAKLIWSNPDIVKNETYYCVGYGTKTTLSNIETTDLSDLAKEIIHSEEISKTGCEIGYVPPPSPELTYVDGYFGRPPVPAHVYVYKPLKRKQIKELQSHLERLSKESINPKSGTKSCRVARSIKTSPNSPNANI